MSKLSRQLSHMRKTDKRNGMSKLSRQLSHIRKTDQWDRKEVQAPPPRGAFIIHSEGRECR